MPAARIRTLFRYGLPLLLLWWLAGAVGKDRSWWTLFPYYLPAPLMVFAGALWWLTARRQAARVLRLFVFALSCTALVKMVVVDFSWSGRRTAPVPAHLRAIHWNVAHGRFGAEAVLTTLRKDNPDLVLLAEVPDTEDFHQVPEELFPGGYSRYESGMLLASRYPFLDLEAPRLPDTRALAVRVGVSPASFFDLLAVDCASAPWTGRRNRMAGIADWAAARRDGMPFLILGDFNTPGDATAFEPLRAHAARAREVQGRGRWPYSWPVLLPVFDIDHAWSSRIWVYDYHLRWSCVSDHARQVLDLRPVPRL